MNREKIYREVQMECDIEDAKNIFDDEYGNLDIELTEYDYKEIVRRFRNNHTWLESDFDQMENAIKNYLKEKGVEA